ETRMRAFRFISSDLGRFPELEGVRYELIDGQLWVATHPGLAHQYACGHVLFALESWRARTNQGLALMGAGGILSDQNEVIPDVMWISDQRRANGLDADGHFTIAPDLTVEVLEAGPLNEARDRVAKPGLYSQWGVREYWIVDCEQESVDVYRS